MSDEDPIRWKEPGSAGPAELRGLFQAGAEDLPTDEQLAALATRLGPLLEGPGAGTGGAATGSAARTKLGVAALGAAGVGVLAWVLVSPRSEPSPAPVTQATESRVAPSVPSHSAVPSVEPPAVAVPAARAASSVEVPPTPGRPLATSPARPAETEAEFLERARGALGQSPSVALSLANQHSARYPSGVLAEEREVIAIEALKRLGRSAEAERRIETFARRYPGSAYRKKLDSGAGR